MGKLWPWHADAATYCDLKAICDAQAHKYFLIAFILAQPQPRPFSSPFSERHTAQTGRILSDSLSNE